MVAIKAVLTDKARRFVVVKPVILAPLSPLPQGGEFRCLPAVFIALPVGLADLVPRTAHKTHNIVETIASDGMIWKSQGPFVGGFSQNRNLLFESEITG
ncbi:MAG: hypothetical protein AAFY14_15845 [Pseudomonadota bacterium]